jgi:hypothetical protein
MLPWSRSISQKNVTKGRFWICSVNQTDKSEISMDVNGAGVHGGRRARWIRHSMQQHSDSFHRATLHRGKMLLARLINTYMYICTYTYTHMLLCFVYYPLF